MPAVDVTDDTFIRVRRGDVASFTGRRWVTWLPLLQLDLAAERGDNGVRWSAAAASGGLRGSAEVWLEAIPAGTVVHLYVRLAPSPAAAPGPVARRRRARHARRLPDDVRRAWKRELHRWKDHLEGGGR